MSLFYLVYGQEMRLLLHPSISDTILEGTILQKIFKLVDHLPTLNMKYGRDKVLLYRAALEYSRSNKFDSK
ncbi:12000_t:CDS:2 [Acaulospora morrowiae]|uniref:12000_t:CDS:1 n=1 Tax=Acaulospora morrowiae TaxID=94023 RepID=A0A9N9IA99_9GLOM|nr:12000_t:CDS:2 [Acaulospora morrowiae]